MDDKPKIQPWGDVTVITGKYIRDGMEKSRYQKIGTLFATPHFSRISIKLDALPMNDGWLSVFPKDKKEPTQAEVILGGEPIEATDIPF